MKRQCPACGSLTSADACCGVRFDRPFVMTTARVMALRRFAHGRKGLSAETYRLHLEAIEADSTLTLTRDQYDRLLARLSSLPDVPRKRERGATC